MIFWSLTDLAFSGAPLAGRFSDRSARDRRFRFYPRKSLTEKETTIRKKESSINLTEFIANQNMTRVLALDVKRYLSHQVFSRQHCVFDLRLVFALLPLPKYWVFYFITDLAHPHATWVVLNPALQASIWVKCLQSDINRKPQFWASKLQMYEPTERSRKHLLESAICVIIITQW